MYGHTKGFLILGQLLSYTGPGNNTCQKKNFSWAPCLFLAKPRQKISLTSASHIYHGELRNHTAKKSSALVQAPQGQVFFASFSSAASFAFLSWNKTNRAVEEDIHWKVGVRSIKGYTPPPASSCTLQALLEKHHPEVSKNPKSRLALSTTSVNLNGPNWNPALKANQQKTTKKSWASQVPKP